VTLEAHHDALHEVAPVFDITTQNGVRGPRGWLRWLTCALLAEESCPDYQ
jgi:hypothetical protein